MSETCPLMFSMSSNIFFSIVLAHGACDHGVHLLMGLKHTESAVARQFGFEDVVAVEAAMGSVVADDDEVDLGFEEEVDDEDAEDK